MQDEAAGVLLDFDGTLTKPTIDWPTMKDEMRLEDGTKILEFLKTAPVDRASEVAEILERHEKEAANRAEFNEGAHELVDYLEERGIPFGVVTNNAWRHVKVMLERFELSIEKVITRDIGIWKPDPRHALAGAEAIGLAPERCIFIGDGQLDMLAARGAGMTAVHLSLEAGPPCDYRVGHLNEAISLIGRLIP
jgi:HAD superfamily hydrolase (TIGR01509 family)